MLLKKIRSFKEEKSSIFILNTKNSLATLPFDAQLKSNVAKKIKELNGSPVFYTHNLQILVFVPYTKIESYLEIEHYRILISKITSRLNALKCKEIQWVDGLQKKEVLLACLESSILSNYQFLKYFSDQSKRKNALAKANVYSNIISQKELDQVVHITQGTSLARDLVNEPLSYLTAKQLSEEAVKAGKQSGYTTTVFNKKKIQALKMGGVLAVNKGSIDPPTFSVLEWKPKKAKNKKPIVLVGKGVVYDTGGLSLKPTKGSMDEMKCDMGGAATVIGTMYAISKLKLPLYVVGLVPATDNRPGQNAYVPGDVIKMHNSKTVEVLNTDAEGRMLLADALSYAKKYKPELVFDFATLTGSAQRAIGNAASAVMGTASGLLFDLLEKSGEKTYERVFRFPFWKEYRQMLNSNIADVKNVGGALAGAITAGKFLEIFTLDKNEKPAYPWIHMDIAGPAFLPANDGYRLKDGTGYGVRLMVDFLTSYASRKKN